MTTLPAKRLEAFEGAARAVAMWTLDLELREVTIQAATYYESQSSSRRVRAEREAVVLLAADVASRFVRPALRVARNSEKHDSAHELLRQYERRRTVQVAWCEYVWQQAYALTAEPVNWALIAALAELLAQFETLPGRTAETYLELASETLTVAGTFDEACELKFISSPFHRDETRSGYRMLRRPPKAPENLAQLAVEIGLVPIADALPNLSARAHRRLAGADIRFASDLRQWNARSLLSIHGIGKTLLKEILQAITQAGLLLERERSHDESQMDPDRWG